MQRRYFVDLFAGCGGLSLGLERAGFMPAYVNEVNADALETYLVNRDDTNPLLRKKHHGNDILHLNGPRLDRLAGSLMEDYGIGNGDLDMVTGGPPCQGYSVIGHRRSFYVQKAQLPYNHLYRDMVRVIGRLRPRMFLFENVGGLLGSRWTMEGNTGEIWEDVLRSFCELPYTVRWDLLRAKEYGVPQNRPRVMMVGLRNDIRADDILGGEVADGMLPAPGGGAPDPVDMLSDLVDVGYDVGRTEKYLHRPRTAIQLELRNGLRRGDKLTEQEYPRHSERVRAKFTHMIAHGGEIPPEYRTKKFYQKVLPERWPERGPNITIASNPVDFVHYVQPRHLTVREWARFQTFPDTYVFRGKRHTGGRRRAGDPDRGIWDREVPKYTQIGNAVPVRLAEAVGRHLHRLLEAA